MQAKLENLISLLQQQGVDADAQELADCLWLAAFKAQYEQQPEQSTDRHQATESTPIKESPVAVKRPTPRNQSDLTKPKSESESEFTPKSPKSSVDLHPKPNVDLNRQHQTGQPSSAHSPPMKPLPFHTPTASALPHSLELGRKLRPLMRRIAASETVEIDEPATVQQIADTGIWLPVMRPQSERWLELLLVIEDSPSMRLWHHTVKELQKLLEQQGAFSDVRVWWLKTKAKTQAVSLHTQADNLRTQAGAASRHYKELINPAQRRLLLVVGDCISPAWQGKELLDWLDAWGRHHPVTLINMLPQQLWTQTRLRTARLVKLRNNTAAAANFYLRQQQALPAWREQPETSRLPIPLTTLEPDFLNAWVRFVTGNADAQIPGFVFQAEPLSAPQTAAEVDEESRFQRFRSVATPTAYRLACYLAAAPLQLPIMRLVQRVMMPDSEQVHLAEVFLSGLLKKVSADDCHPDEITYEFLSEALCNRFLNAGLVPDSVRVLEHVSSYIDEHHGSPSDFRAMIFSSDAAADLVLSGKYQAFAKVWLRLLKLLGGEYARLGDNSEERSDEANTVAPTALQVELRSELRNGPLKGAILLDPAWREKWPDLSIPVINKNLNLLHSGPKHAKKEIKSWKQDAAKLGWLLLTPDDLFTANLTEFAEGSVLPDGFHPLSLEKHLLPLKPLVLALFNPNELRGAFTIVNDRSENCPVAQLTFRLDNGEQLLLKQVYPDVPKKVVPPALLTQWPGYVSPIWRHYYLDSVGDRDCARIERALAPKRLPTVLSGVAMQDAVASVRQWFANDNAHLFIDTPREHPQLRSSLLADRPMEAVLFEGSEGLCLVQPASAPNVAPDNSSFNIGVDFGSSATQILVKHGAALPVGPLDALLTVAFGSIRTDKHAVDASQHHDGRSLLLSLLGTRFAGYVHATAESEMPRGDTFIPFPRGWRAVQKEMLDCLLGSRPMSFGNNYEFGFKYAGGKGGSISFTDQQRRLVHRALMESCLLGAAVAVGRGASHSSIEWAFAYPGTYLAHNQQEFQDWCKHAVAFTSASALDKAVSQVARPPRIMALEPLAANHFFRKQRGVVANEIAVVIDIGGHSTDICISCQGEPVWVGSLALAGQCVLTDFFVFNSWALNDITTSDIAAAFDNAANAGLLNAIRNGGQTSHLALRAYIEIIFATLERPLSEICGQQVKERVENLARLFLYGLLSYLNRILQRCYDDKKLENDLGISLSFCGRGSRIIGDFLLPKAINAACTEFLGDLPGVRHRVIAPEFIEMETTKQEVALGLLGMLEQPGDYNNSRRIADHSPMPLGEKVQVMGSSESYEANAYIPANKFERHRILALPNIDNFEQFIDQAKMLGVTFGNVDRGRLIQETQSLFEAECESGEEARKVRVQDELNKEPLIQLQPPFVLALRSCIGMLVRS